MTPWASSDDFEIETNDTFLDIWKQISSIFFSVVIGIASISLVVGGIVIMNIMLVSVTERTREIGVRKALGARQRDVLLQFLIESGTMALIGGFIGVMCGVIVAKLITLIIGFPTSVQARVYLLERRRPLAAFAPGVSILKSPKGLDRHDGCFPQPLQAELCGRV